MAEDIVANSLVGVNHFLRFLHLMAQFGSPLDEHRDVSTVLT